MERTWAFDKDWTRTYTEVRQAFLRSLLGGLSGKLELKTALDVGCGVGAFSKFLSELGFQVLAVDGRVGNIDEGQRRHPEITFLTRDAEDAALPEIGTFDFVLCVGLLYHLENPFRAMRNLFALTGKVLVVESMCAPGDQPRMELLDEYREEDQGLNYVAFYPTESCLVKMLYRAGFPFVYGLKRLPNHPAFCATRSRRRQRTILVASREILTEAQLTLQAEPSRSWDIWARVSRLRKMRSRLGRFVRKVRNSSKPIGTG